MKTLISAAALASCLTLSCTHSDKTAGDASAKEGWEDMKEGGRKTGEGMGEVATATGDTIKDDAKAAGHSVKEGALKAGHAIKASACPVVADKTSRRYYTKSDKQYNAMLKGEKVMGEDNRECFMSEANAREDGYQSVGR